MQIGNIQVDKGVLLAPMEDVTDLPFRLVCKRLGADIVYTEFISSEGLVRDAKRSVQKLAVEEEERPVAIQIFGGHGQTMAEAAIRAEAAGPDFIDINCGCWVKNVVQRNAGAALLKDPDGMVELVQQVVDAVDMPVTVKTRLGWDKNNINILEVAKRLEQTGIQALALHARTRDMGHRGQVMWEWIAKVKDAISIPVILNGDVVSPETAKQAFDETGCDAVMIGRAAIANPFIFRQVKSYFETGAYAEPDIQERIEICLEHLRHSLKFKGEYYGIIEFRKYYSGYLKGMYNAANARRDLVTYKEYAEIEDRLYQYREELQDYRARREAEQAIHVG